MKKRAALARALALDPKLLISDEPTSGLDPVSTKEIDNLTIILSRKSGATVIVVTHDLLSFQRIARRGIMLGAERDGKLRGTVLISGSRDEFFASKHPLVRSFLHPEDDAVFVAAGGSYQTVEGKVHVPVTMKFFRFLHGLYEPALVLLFVGAAGLLLYALYHAQ